MTAIFITATAPDVGETNVAAALIRHLRQMGHEVDAIKPIVTGYDRAQAASSEPARLLSALGLPFSPEEIDRITPWRFRAPVTPDLAARREGRSIDVDEVIAFCQSAIDQDRGIMLIEGVGGIMVPLDEHRTMLDVMMALRLPMVLVTGSYPGAVSHALTALDSLFRRDLDVLTTIVSEVPGSPLLLDDAVATIGRFAEPVIGVPRLRNNADAGADSPFGRIFGGRRTPADPK